jgi:centractin
MGTGILKLSYPTRHGITNEWKDMQSLWQYTYNSLNIVQDQHPVLLTEAAINPKKNRFALFHSSMLCLC